MINLVIPSELRIYTAFLVHHCLNNNVVNYSTIANGLNNLCHANVLLIDPPAKCHKPLTLNAPSLSFPLSIKLKN